MAIHVNFEDCIKSNDRYYTAVKFLDGTHDDSLLRSYYDELVSSDTLICDGGIPSDALYKTVFAKTVAPKIIPSITHALRLGQIPTFEISFDELDATRKSLSLKPFGSPQDVLYTFTSDRAPDWGVTLSSLMFRSACMVGQSKVLVTIAPRFLDIETPDFETDELEGAISQDFWESNLIVTNQAPFKSTLLTILSEISLCKGVEIDSIAWTEQLIRDFFAQATSHLNNKIACLAHLLLNEIGDLSHKDLLKNWNKKINQKPSKARSSQEQIALKYIDEGRFLQKLLGGLLVDHLQSNVKMQKNPYRGNKVEVDSIYRAIGRKQIILVEAKDNLRVSRTQLYSIYEAYRLRIPQDWEVTVVAALLSKPENASGPISQIIDLIQVDFNDCVLGKIPESLFGVVPKKHFRWNITNSH